MSLKFVDELHWLRCSISEMSTKRRWNPHVGYTTRILFPNTLRMVFPRKLGNLKRKLIELTVGQHHSNHLRDHCDLRETLYSSPVPQNLCAFQKGKSAIISCNTRLCLELTYFLSSGYFLLDFLMHSPREDMESAYDYRSLLRG